ncbi:putative replication protein E1 [Etapapillomavirus 1]|nr:putative replication protein E1 [Etapapillomavirus 1]AAL14228.1 putative replication protein E1 [Etapapillomavirus 1]ANN44254.1 E1 [Etapapillomavirus 1]
MDFIDTEAAVEGDSNPSSSESDSEDTVSLLFAATPEDGAFESPGTSPDRSLHRQLLLQQQQQQRDETDTVLRELVQGGCNRKRRASSTHSNDPVANIYHKPCTVPQTVHSGSIPLPKAMRLYSSDALSSSNFFSTKENLCGASTGGLAGHSSRQTYDVHMSNAKRVPKALPLRDLGNRDAVHGPKRTVFPPATDSLSEKDESLSHSEGYSSLPTCSGVETSSQGKERSSELLQRCLTSKNRKLSALAAFKKMYNASYYEVAREYKSDKTQSYEWVLFMLGCSPERVSALNECLKGVTEFILYDCNPTDYSALFYLEFYCSKNREGVRRLLKNYNVDTDSILLLNPPNKRSVLAALFYQKLVLAHGDFPDWCRDILSNEQLSGEGFELSQMIQWALDNKHHDEGSIAYHYAIHAEQDNNAKLWLQSNQQAKYVRDAATMVRHFVKGRLHSITMSEHIAAQIREYDVESTDEDGWKKILVFLTFQHINFKEFISILCMWLKGRPKKSCITIAGVPDSGKSMFAYSLIKFLNGSVLSFANSKSHFWLQPLTECKAALIDDVTLPCWDYVDTFLRNALDGNAICIDCKHRAPVQTKCPPLLLTSNYDPRLHGVDSGGGNRYKYLNSRIQFLLFNRVIPLYGTQPRFYIEPADWRSFFQKYSEDLQLQITEYDGSQAASETPPATREGEPVVRAGDPYT